jgi:hypothetical protein
MDRRREPLSGAEKRDCWASPAAANEDGIFGAPQVPVLPDPIELTPAPLIEARVPPR